ncbi:hypothetical protein QBC43DRAFT_54765 [Cladorrhinum sp. PSN259]|nr:hypothetical protein QBC43DRAFT_54765 [Cladorrhinum sp. PSN259]
MATASAVHPAFGPQPPPSPSPSPDIKSSGSGFYSEDTQRTISRLSPCIEERTEDDIAFREPVQIPDCSPPTFVYPHSSAAIDVAFHDRFREVVSIFRHNTLEDPRLRENARFIDYTLRLCGPSPAASHPSILVFCRNKVFKYLRPLLTSKELKFQYALRKPPRRFPWSKPEAPPLATDHRPSFNLYFWRESIPRTLFCGQRCTITLESRPHTLVSELTHCGTVIWQSDSTVRSILGCVIQVGSEWYSMTAKHASNPDISSRMFKPPLKLFRESDNPKGLDEPLRDLEKELLETHCQDDDDDIYVIDDVEYGNVDESDDEDEDKDEEDEDDAHLMDFDEAIPDVHRMVDTSCVFLTTAEQLKLGGPDCDWALIKLDDPKDWRPNAFLRVPHINNPAIQFISTVAETFPTRETPVLVITMGDYPAEATLQPGTSFLGGINGDTPSEVHVLILKHVTSLGFGDSGALVVDAETSVIYGHVIGCNPLGEVYISSFQTVLDQIQQRFPDVSVSLPEPSQTFKNLLLLRGFKGDKLPSQSRQLAEVHPEAAAERNKAERKRVELENEPELLPSEAAAERSNAKRTHLKLDDDLRTLQLQKFQAKARELEVKATLEKAKAEIARLEQDNKRLEEELAKLQGKLNQQNLEIERQASVARPQPLPPYDFSLYFYPPPPAPPPPTPPFFPPRSKHHGSYEYRMYTDENSPCNSNTLYVENLPIDASEEELGALFTKQQGYKRMSFRTKTNGPMCFVEFEDTASATRALTELDGVNLNNSVNGGIRLSFSKNPLGIRSGQSVDYGFTQVGLQRVPSPPMSRNPGVGSNDRDSGYEPSHDRDFGYEPSNDRDSGYVGSTDLFQFMKA